MANALSAIGWLIGRMVGVALLPVSLLVFFVLGYAFVIGKPFGLDPYLTKPYGVLMMAVGAYWLWLGTRLVRGRLAVTFDPRRFVAGNLGLLFACLALLTGVAAGSRDEVPADAAALPFAAGALWLWTAIRLLKVDGTPAAGLGRFVAGNVLIAAALACVFLGVVISEVVGLPGPGAIALVASLALLALAAWLLRVAAPRQLRAEEARQQDAVAAEQAQHPDTRWRWRHVGGFAVILLGFVVWLKGFIFCLLLVWLGLRGRLAEDASIVVAVATVREVLFVVFGAICFWIGLRFFRGRQEKLSTGNLVFIIVTAVLYTYAVFTP